ncbi:MAG: carbohydrate kinase family protein [Anaerolineae bacterium]|nr:carbohydrate kinase family protein [Anaerolineae bacterium]
MTDYDVVVLGDYFFDQIFTGLPKFPTLGCETFADNLTTTGGALFITAAALSRLEVHAGWIGTFGQDPYSEFVYRLAQDEGIDLALTRRLDGPYQRVTTSMPFEGERAFVTFADPDTEDMFDFWMAQLAASSFRHAHLGGFLDAEHLRPLAELVHARGATLSMDCQDGDFLRDPRACREAIVLADCFMPNAREAKIIAETDDLQDAIRTLTQMIPLVVVKDGARGAWICNRDGVQHVPSIQAGPAIDTTGAGDCFNAGFLYGYLVEGAPLDVCARYGNICGGLSVTGIGGATNSPRRAELLDWLKRTS